MLGLQLLEDFFVFGKTQSLVLAVNHFAIDLDVKNAPLAGNQFDVDAFGRLDGGRQTGGLWCVVSHRAISNFDLHVGCLC